MSRIFKDRIIRTISARTIHPNLTSGATALPAVPGKRALRTRPRPTGSMMILKTIFAI